jgi:pimeloyl-ACP methyl ester carboxylesterase
VTGNDKPSVLLLTGARQVEPLLAQHFHVLNAPDTQPVAVVAQGQQAADALRLALERPELVERLVLAEPECPPDIIEALPGVGAPTLVLWGTASPKDEGELYHRRLPRAHLMYVYGELTPEAIARLGADFIERGDAFPVMI